ncbi:MAG: hypothetical protein NDF51_03385 [archaeon YNP-WB-040]|jgi:V/A-type H+-transporting ATPase subunit I|nr:hypothetical protein [Candidatus Culexarchaeum yellowstonense]
MSSALKPVEMAKVRIIIPKSYYYDVKLALTKLKVLHLDEWWHDEEFVELIREERSAGGEVDVKSLVKEHPETVKFNGLLKRYMSLADTLKIDVASFTFNEELLNRSHLKSIEENISRLESIVKEFSNLLESGGEEGFAEFKSKVAESFPNYESFIAGAINTLKVVLDRDGNVFHSNFFSYMLGWAPPDKVDDIVETVQKVTENSSMVLVSPPAKHDHPPFLSQSPKFLKPFESLIKTYDIPSTHEVNPTLIVSITFPILFGLAFADVGHGLLLALFGILLYTYKRRGFKSKSEMIGLLMSGAELYILCGIMAIIGGLMFGEIFGFHMHEPPLGFILEHIPGIGHVFSPLEEPMKMFKLSLMVGIIHISIGLTLSIINDVLEGEYKKAFFGSACWLWFYLGAMYLGLFVYKFDIGKWMSGLTLTVPLVILPIVLMLVGMMITEGPIDGFAHTFEAAISSLSHTVSYGRILALSLSHGMLSQLLSSAAPALGALGYIVLAIGTIFLVMALEGLVSFTHVLRLTWVEFGFKYFRGGGREYKPLGVH